MRLLKVTITGADDGIDVIKLSDLSNKYPFVEWGILFSKTKQGQSRYPTLEWFNKLSDVCDNPEVKLSAHLCGQWVVDLFGDDFSFARHVAVASYFERIQLNMTDDRFMTLDFGRLKNVIIKELREPTPDIIIQTKRAFQRYEWLRTLNAESRGLKFNMLYDVSGGKGVLPKNWVKPVDGVFCGFAGGLGPDNLEEQLPKIAAAVGDCKCWIDMESRVRDENDKFDLAKVEKCLEIASKWITHE